MPIIKEYHNIWLSMSLLLMFLLLLIYLQGLSPATEMNIIKSIKTVTVPTPGIEIEVYSTTPFPVRALPPVLQIGNREFTRSRYPTVSNFEQAQEQLHTLIFFLPAEEFADLATGDPVTVYYGHKAGSGYQWDFGTFDKDIVDQ